MSQMRGLGIFIRRLAARSRGEMYSSGGCNLAR
jgi:hypothetical protein